MNSKTLRTGICKFLIIISVGFMIYGILVVNMNLPQVVRQNSRFYVSSNERNSKINIKIGEFNIVLNGKPFKNFVKGTKVVGDTIKELILPSHET
ncbi:hypothetical protein [Clostridium sp. UBA7503]|uniref:hypothetical protein n=1 Tax=Clostridium sp. UBA7503 TaxID=1946377 RepID=UPI0032173B47